MDRPIFPQALSTALVARLKNTPNPLFIASLPARGSKRAASSRINYAEDFELDFEDDQDQDYDEDGAAGSRNNANGAGVNMTLFKGKDAPREKYKTVFTEAENLANCSVPEQMVPIKLNLETSGTRVNDLFMWNLNESLVTPELFATIMCQELDLPKYSEATISGQIREQLDAYRAITSAPLPQLFQEKELHAIMDISISLDNTLYEDKIEWDILNSAITPEEFARTVVADMGLQREFQNAIAISLHDAIYKLKKEFLENPQQILFNNESLPLLNKVYQPPAPEAENGSPGVVSLELQGLRFDSKKYGTDFSPRVETLTPWEIEKREIERERNIRRLKRETMRVSGIGSSMMAATPANDRNANSKRKYDELEGTWKFDR
ncbi:hypothetical protein OGAPHI_005878 [Ogataea philodendri]|uniref:Chromatin structure-remodeling complex subunit SFH1 n=1 Tax=Ogataea philodendri TaxID=1378263 RepID=A0A9P8T1K1_9ASCO|nr:uncharacterized protein OGAPHI_005878 [Ogataea philodendri]KAH3662626.1 hypothetical protein OGAPHI_005878 [Ogataea philodendri]